MSADRENGSDRVSGSAPVDRAPHCWAVTGVSRPFYGEDAEAEARAEAKQMARVKREAEYLKAD